MADLGRCERFSFENHTYFPFSFAYQTNLPYMNRPTQKYSFRKRTFGTALVVISSTRWHGVSLILQNVMGGAYVSLWEHCVRPMYRVPSTHHPFDMDMAIMWSHPISITRRSCPINVQHGNAHTCPVYARSCPMS